MRNSEFKCTVCNKLIEEEKYNIHVFNCKNKINNSNYMDIFFNNNHRRNYFNNQNSNNNYDIYNNNRLSLSRNGNVYSSSNTVNYFNMHNNNNPNEIKENSNTNFSYNLNLHRNSHSHMINNPINNPLYSKNRNNQNNRYHHRNNYRNNYKNRGGYKRHNNERNYNRGGRNNNNRYYNRKNYDNSYRVLFNENNNTIKLYCQFLTTEINAVSRCISLLRNIIDEYLQSGNQGNDENYNFTDLFNELFYQSSNGVNENLLISLPKIKVDDDSKLEQDKCVICLENFKKGDELIRTPCFHCFHSKCIIEWFKNNNTCPICKFEVK